MGYFIGIDSSTTATKALLMDVKGNLSGVAVSEYSYDMPKPLWSEQHPDLWWQATVNSLRSVIKNSDISPKEIQGIGLTEQMHGYYRDRRVNVQ